MTALPDRDLPVISASQLLLRQLNSTAVLQAVRAATAPQRVADLAAATGLSRPTVDAVVSGLVNQGWLETDATTTAAPRNPGRPARRYGFHAAAGHVAGVDVGAHSVSAAITDLAGKTVAKGRTRTSPSLPTGGRMKAITALLSSLLTQAHLQPSQLRCLTMGTLGVVDPVKRRIIISPGLGGWSEFDAAGALQAALGCPVLLENDANLAAEAERWRGVAHGCDSVMVLLLGERLGAGIISGGVLLRGHNGAAGELGYVTSGSSRAPGRETGMGPLESRVNANALVTLTRERLETAKHSLLDGLVNGDPTKINPQVIGQAARAGDPTARQVVEEICARLAEGIAPSLLTLDPELLIVGGGMSGVGDLLKTTLESQLATLVMFPPRVQLSTLGDEAVVTGAIRQSLDYVERRIIKNIIA